jgi:Domain of unknown function (DUF4397)
MSLILPRSVTRGAFVACVASMALLGSAAAASAASAGHASQAGPAAHAAHNGWLRLAHLSPNTPAVDVYLYSFGNSKAEVVLHHVTYGTVSPYLPAPAGTYTVEMRAAGAAPSSPPVISTAVKVKAGDAYTVAGMGPQAGLRLVVLDDKLSAPSGRSMVRVIQASMRERKVTVRAKSDVLGHDLGFATATAFQAISRGDYTVSAKGGTESASDKVKLASGSIHTLVILDSASHLKIVDLTDAVGSKTIPTAAPATGFGGTAAIPGPSIVPWAVLMSIGLLVAAAGLITFRRSRSRLLGSR